MIAQRSVDETNDFLSRITTTTNSAVTGNLNAIPALGDVNPAGVVGGNRPVTGAVDPLIPMIFRMADENGNPISFTLLVNPESLNHGKTASSQAIYTRKGFVIQLWGPNQDTFSATGRTGGFIVDGPGYSSIGQRKSVAFKNLMALIAVYRNNGYDYFDPFKGETDRNFTSRVINVVKGIELYYDGCTMMGHFNNFTLDNDAERPFSMNINFEFVVSNLNAGADDGYSEIYGHFLPIGVAGGKPGASLLDKSFKEYDQNFITSEQERRRTLMAEAQARVEKLRQQTGYNNY